MISLEQKACNENGRDVKILVTQDSFYSSAIKMIKFSYMGYFERTDKRQV